MLKAAFLLLTLSSNFSWCSDTATSMTPDNFWPNWNSMLTKRVFKIQNSEGAVRLVDALSYQVKPGEKSLGEHYTVKSQTKINFIIAHYKVYGKLMCLRDIQQATDWLSKTQEQASDSPTEHHRQAALAIITNLKTSELYTRGLTIPLDSKPDQRTLLTDGWPKCKSAIDRYCAMINDACIIENAPLVDHSHLMTFTVKSAISEDSDCFYFHFPARDGRFQLIIPKEIVPSILIFSARDEPTLLELTIEIVPRADRLIYKLKTFVILESVGYGLSSGGASASASN
jgi:hypothetical protein